MMGRIRSFGGTTSSLTLLTLGLLLAGPIACGSDDDANTGSTAGGTAGAGVGGKTGSGGAMNTVAGSTAAPVKPVCGNGVVETGEGCDEGAASATTGSGTRTCSPGCKLPNCGDAVINTGEECDNGSTNSDSAACTSNCKNARCGDGLIQTGKDACDQGINNSNTGDCTLTCQLAKCGDGYVQAGEACDEGPASAVGGPGSATCLPGCKGIGIPTCGNGTKEGTEACDDGNSVNTDGCTNTCQLPRCGDGYQQGTEECDLGGANNDTGSSCTNACKNARCGDGIKQLAEACDEGPSSAVGAAGTITCAAGCKLALCGNGVTDPGEACDDGNQVNTDACTNTCTVAICGDAIAQTSVDECDEGPTSAVGGPGTATCLAGCKKPPVPVCGNGTLDAGEGCDEGATSAPTGTGTATCAAGCKKVQCGDGIVQAGEPCDDGNNVNTDACSNTCQLPACGDGIVNTVGGVLEECDLGESQNSNTAMNGCTKKCKNAACNDGFVNTPNELCDKGADNVQVGSTTDGTKCTVACIWASACGNGKPDTGEECDDGNGSNWDDCLVTCKKARCGDGFRRATTSTLDLVGPEQCDDGNTSNEDSCVQGCKIPTCGDNFQYKAQSPVVAGSNNPAWLPLIGVPIITNVTTGATSTNSSGLVEACDDGFYDATTKKGNSDANPCRLNCTAAACGDGIKGANEDCDVGPDNATGGIGYPTCAPGCKTPTCGDGLVNAAEECDDANTVNTDGCVACKVAKCGDGYIGPGESCDIGASASTTTDDVLPTGAAAAGVTCDVPTQTKCILTSCGDQVKQAWEACDDGTYDATTNPNGNGHGTSTCTLACTTNKCGDGHLLGNAEGCDLGGWNGNGAHTSSLTGLACSSTCKVNRCGDGFKATGNGEECDDAANNGKASSRCNVECKLDYCGDGYVNTSIGTTANPTSAQWAARLEECDNGAGNNGELKTCTKECRKNACGDGMVGAGEACDPAATYYALASGSGTSTLPDGVTCLTTCALSTCGNGTVQTTEQCEPLLSPQTCTPRCMTNICGDGFPALTSTTNGIASWTAKLEACDDGEANSGVGTCESNCTAPACGNGVIDSGEECELGTTDWLEPATTVPSAITSTVTSFCGSDCKKRCSIGLNSNAIELPSTGHPAVPAVLYGSGESCLFLDVVSSYTATSSCPSGSTYVVLDSQAKQDALVGTTGLLIGRSPANKPWIINKATADAGTIDKVPVTYPISGAPNSPLGLFFADWYLSEKEPNTAHACVILNNQANSTTLPAYHWFTQDCPTAVATMVCEKSFAQALSH